MDKRDESENSALNYWQWRTFLLRKMLYFKVYNLARRCRVPVPKVKFVTKKLLRHYDIGDFEGLYFPSLKAIFLKSLTTKHVAVHEFVHYYLDVKGFHNVGNEEALVEKLTGLIVENPCKASEILEGFIQQFQDGGAVV
jgi:hypothetical protein